MIATVAHFSPHDFTDFYGEKSVAFPNYLCDNSSTIPELNNQIAIVDRGHCFFDEKVISFHLLQS